MLLKRGDVLRLVMISSPLQKKISMEAKPISN